MNKKKILLYTISLTVVLLLIVFCILLLIEKNTFKKYNSVDIGYYNNYFEDNCGATLSQFLETKKFKKYQFTGNENSDDKIFKEYQSKIRELVKSNDSIAGVHLVFNKKTKYEDVIKAFDICNIENAKSYIVKDYDIWVTNGMTKEFQRKFPFKTKVRFKE